MQLLTTAALALTVAACSPVEPPRQLSPTDAAADSGAPIDAAPACPTGWQSPRAAPPSGGAWRLSETGLYCALAARVVAPGLAEYEPAYKLWSDGSDKRRWLELPPGATIDRSDEEHWRFPVGTRLWKEFRRGERLLETRLIERTGPGPMDYWMGAFVWVADGSDALFVRDGEENVLGTDHDVPAAEKCWSCHRGEPGRILGVSAIQLAPPGRAPAGIGASSFVVPGPPHVRAALGYLHANCGHCHSDNGPAWRDTDVVFRLFVAESGVAPEATAIYRTSIGVALQSLRRPGFEFRVAPGNTAGSGVVVRMRSREMRLAMPPLASKHPDDVGLQAIEDWIAGL